MFTSMYATRNLKVRDDRTFMVSTWETFFWHVTQGNAQFVTICKEMTHKLLSASVVMFSLTSDNYKRNHSE